MTVVSTAVIQNMVDIKWKVTKCCHQNHFCIPVNIISLPDALNFYISPATKVLSHFVPLLVSCCPEHLGSIHNLPRGWAMMILRGRGGQITFFSYYDLGGTVENFQRKLHRAWGGGNHFFLKKKRK